MVINCTAEMEHKSQKMYVVVAAAEKYLGIQDFTSEKLQSMLSSGVPSRRHGAGADSANVA